MEANPWCLLGMKLGPNNIRVMIQRLVEYIAVEILYLKRKANGIGEIQTWKIRKVLFIL